MCASLNSVPPCQSHGRFNPYVSHRALRAGCQCFSALGRGGLSPRLARLGHDLLNIMGQYRLEYEVGQIAGDGVPAKYAEIDRRPAGDELKLRLRRRRSGRIVALRRALGGVRQRSGNLTFRD